MTKLEAIERLENLLPWMSEEYCTALKIAIISLEEEGVYRLLYEGRRMFTEAEVIAILGNVCYQIIDAIPKLDGDFDSHFRDGFRISKQMNLDIVQRTIRDLKKTEECEEKLKT